MSISKPPARTTTPLCYAVHCQGTSPVFDDSTTHVLVDDDAAGPFIVLRQFGTESKVGEVRLDIEDLEAIVLVARRLIKAQA